MSLVWKASEHADPEPGADMEKSPAVVEIMVDEETGETRPEYRPTNVLNSLLVAFTIILIICMLGLGWRQIAFQVIVDKSYIRCAFILMGPVLIFISLVSPNYPYFQ
jgi:hypothetical protein